MDGLTEEHIKSPSNDNENGATFEAIFFPRGSSVSVRVPDYQRAFSWERKQIELFLADLVQIQGSGKRYYFGHFIAENRFKDEEWEIVDGQQRITTFVLFLMVCQFLSPEREQDCAYSMIEKFSTVGYDNEALKTIRRNLGAFLQKTESFDEKMPPSDEEIINSLSLEGTFTRSQRRIALTLLRFYHAFKKGLLKQDRIADYIEIVMKSFCSSHLTKEKSVAVNIFEMHNTRGIPLTTLEIIKAKLMKFVYDNCDEEQREKKVEDIQTEFGKIYGMEEQMAVRSFRGNMTMEQLFRLHLRVVDDGSKKIANQLRSPSINANSDQLIEYVNTNLVFVDGDRNRPRDPKDGVQYAISLAKEFKKSVRIVTESLPKWDEEDTEKALVGDVLILERDLSCQFFLVVCRLLESELDKADGRVGIDTLKLWEKLLFTRNFHSAYYNLKGGRDDFPTLFASCGLDEKSIEDVIKRYLTDGFRPEDKTKGLQSIVVKFLNDNRERILKQAFLHWWKDKMIYAIYKYEISKGANIRNVMKGTISVEHILPQEWHWIRNDDEYLRALSDDEWTKFSSEINACINGIGNLLLITPGENTSEGNKHPADKTYGKYLNGGSYKEHNEDKEKWRSPEKWSQLIQTRGEKMFAFMMDTLVGSSESNQSWSNLSS